ncbi:MAG: S8 family serine peptidase [Actinomycetota bacterium]
MRRLAPLALSVSVVLALVPAAGAGARAEAPIDPPVLATAGRQSALVHVEPSASLEAGVEAARAAGLDLGTTYPMINVFVAYGDRDAFRKVAASPVVEQVEANSLLELLTNTSHIATRGQDVLDGAVTLPDGTVIDGTGVGVAVVDTGVEGTHPDLESRMGGNVRIYCTAPGAIIAIGISGLGFSECRGPKVVVPLDDTDTPGAGGHGTHVAGIVAGDGTASEATFHGAAPGATLFGVAVGTTLLVENALDGLRWVLDNHDQVDPPIRVVNNSWGGGPGPGDEDNVLQGAITKLQNLLIGDGVTVVFAAGNSGGNGSNQQTTAQCALTTPGNVCVASYDDGDTGTRDGSLSSFSSRGSAANAATWPDISAPGQFIISTCRYTLPVCWVHAGQQLDPPNSYSELSGTSMAAPHISGIIAQLYQANPDLTPALVEEVLEDTAHKFTFGAPYQDDPFNPDDTSSFDKGHGLVDVLAAVQAVLPEPVEPSLEITAPEDGSIARQTITVSGTASHPGTVTVAVDGVEVGAADGSAPMWSFDLDTLRLREGLRQVSATLSAADGVTARDAITIVVDNCPPYQAPGGSRPPPPSCRKGGR